jgi:hypothetical protein
VGVRLRRVAERDHAGAARDRVELGLVGPPLLKVLGPADHVVDDLGRRLDVDLALDASQLHAVLLALATTGCT